MGVGTPGLVLGAGAEYLQLPLDNISTGEHIVINIGGITGAVGVGASTPLELSFSLPSFPSDGIGRIVAGTRAPSQLSAAGFTGNSIRTYGVSVSAGGSPGFGSLVAILFFENIAVGVATGIIPTVGDDLAVARCGGLFYGTGARSGVFAGLEGMTGVVANVQRYWPFA